MIDPVFDVIKTYFKYTFNFIKYSVFSIPKVNNCYKSADMNFPNEELIDTYIDFV